jgi:hypothetical protein
MSTFESVMSDVQVQDWLDEHEAAGIEAEKGETIGPGKQCWLLRGGPLADWPEGHAAKVLVAENCPGVVRIRAVREEPGILEAATIQRLAKAARPHSPLAFFSSWEETCDSMAVDAEWKQTTTWGMEALVPAGSLHAIDLAKTLDRLLVAMRFGMTLLAPAKE